MGNILSRIGNIIKWMLIVILAGSILLVLLFKYVPVYTSPLMFIRTYQQVSNGEQIRWHHEWVDLEEISPNLPLAVMASEDQNFLNHSGFDWEAIQKVIEERTEGKRMRGGSTIRQQTAKNVFLWPGSSWLRKGLEAYFTVLIECIWGKRRIMEVYLNSIEMGDGVYGAEAVAQWHFNRSSSELTRANCALVAATLPNPLKFDSRKPSKYILRRQTAIMGQMRHISVFPAK